MANLEKQDIMHVIDDAILDMNKHLREVKPRSTPSEIIFNILTQGFGVSCIVCLNESCNCKPRVK